MVETRRGLQTTRGHRWRCIGAKHRQGVVVPGQYCSCPKRSPVAIAMQSRYNVEGWVASTADFLGYKDSAKLIPRVMWRTNSTIMADPK